MLLFCRRDCSSHTMGCVSGAAGEGGRERRKWVRADSTMASHNSGTQGLLPSYSVTRENKNRQAIVTQITQHSLLPI